MTATTRFLTTAAILAGLSGFLAGAARADGGKATKAASTSAAKKTSAKKATDPKTHQTYTKTNPATGQVYSGRTSGSGTPLANLAKRDKTHHMNDKGFGPAVLDKSSTDARAIRGREQHLIDKHGGALSEGGSSGNAIRGVSAKNKKKAEYEAAAHTLNKPKP